MIRLLAVAAVLSVAGAAHAHAQGATPGAAHPPAAASESRPALDAAAFDARAARFEAQMDQMSREIEAAVQASGGDRDAALSAVDEILARYHPEVDGFAADFDAFLAVQETLAADDPGARGQLAEARTAVVAVIRSIPGQIRNGVTQNLDAQAAEGRAAAPL